MIRDIAKALVAVLAILILTAEVQRADDAAADQFKHQHAGAARR